MFNNIYKGKRVLITGHTGFKGAWLAEWLISLGAIVIGVALPPASEPNLFTKLKLARRMDHNTGDICDPETLRMMMELTQPDFVFHLAAQPLVRAAYIAPSATWHANVMGTVNMLEAVRHLARPCNVVIVTSDKCYENREWHHGYRETDALGGYDPYSASKAAAELAVASWRRSFLDEMDIRVATARAGNVIGGHDWAEHRIVPDCMRACAAGKPIVVRNPEARRAWMHVLDVLSGYLALGAELSNTSAAADAWNFGGTLESNRTVRDLVSHLPVEAILDGTALHAHEAQMLNLSSDKAFHVLQWRPAWDFETAVQKTVEAYRALATLPLVITRQIEEYTEAAAANGIRWACE